MFRCQIVPVISRSSRKNTVKLKPIAELTNHIVSEPADEVSMKSCPHEHDKEHTWHPSVSLLVLWV